MPRGGSKKGRTFSAEARAKMSQSARERGARERAARERADRVLKRAASRLKEDI